MNRRRQIEELDLPSVPCPECGAGTDEPCRDLPAERFHKARWQAVDARLGKLVRRPDVRPARLFVSVVVLVVMFGLLFALKFVLQGGGDFETALIGGLVAASVIAVAVLAVNYVRRDIRKGK